MTELTAAERAELYRVGEHYRIHVYQGDRAVATFFRADEAARFVAAANNQQRTADLIAAVDQLKSHWIGEVDVVLLDQLQATIDPFRTPPTDAHEED